MAQLQFSMLEDVIETLISEGWTYKQISEYLSDLNGDSRGLSARTVRRYCADWGMGHRRNCIDRPELERVLVVAIGRVGHVYGRRTMHGLLASQGLAVSQARVSSAMEQLALVEFASR